MYYRCSFEGYVPAWYELDVADEGRTLVLRVEQGAADLLFAYLRTTRLARNLERGLKVPSFLQPGVLPWGFGPVLVLGESQGPWVTMECDLPALFSDSDGETYASQERWERAWALAATWVLLLSCLQQIGCDYQSSLKEGQILEVELAATRMRGMANCPIEAGLSQRVLHWLRGQGEVRQYQPVSDWMYNAHLRLRGKGVFDEDYRRETYATIRQPDRIDFGCVGDRTGLNPSHDFGFSQNHRKGYDLLPHNVDSPTQQMVLLVGLAALSSLVRVG